MPDGSVSVNAVGELALIRDVFAPNFRSHLMATNTWIGIGDDSAMIPLGNGDAITISTDRVPADFLAKSNGAIGYGELGRYLAHLAVSDIVACGALPLALVVNLAFPAERLVADLQQLSSGLATGASECSIPIVGGDTSVAGEDCFSATAVGRIAAERFVSRRGAQPGDLVFCSRPVGDGAAAFHLLTDSQERNSGWRVLCANHFDSISAEVRLLSEMRNLGVDVRACIDNTDGLGASLQHLAQESEVSILIDFSPAHVGELAKSVFSHLTPKQLLGPGVDLSLVGTARPSPQLFKFLATNPGISIIGKVRDAESHGIGLTHLEQGLERRIEVAGWEYFR